MRGISVPKEGPRHLRKNGIVSPRSRAAIGRAIVVTAVLAVLSVCTPTPPVCPAAQVTLAWDPNPDPTVAGYRVYCGTSSRHYSMAVDSGSRPYCTITGLQPGITYFLAATAYAETGGESSLSDEIAYTVPSQRPPPSGSGGGGGGGCFIATAAYGSSLAPEVATLRAFRDEVLMASRPGRAFVEWYYRASPPAAEWIAGNEPLRIAARWGLAPVVYSIRYPAAALLLLLSIPFAMAAGRRIRRRS